MTEKILIESQIEKKEQEIEALKAKLKSKKMELQLLQEKKKSLEEKAQAEFNAKVVSEMEQRFGKFDENTFEIFLKNLDGKNSLSGEFN